MADSSQMRNVPLEAPMDHPPFRSAAVLGSGTMGAQIAAHLANAGLQVHLLDVTPSEIGKEGSPNAIVEKGFKQAKKASPDPFFSDHAAERITLGNLEENFDRIGEVEWVIEAVVERLDVKQDLMERVEGAVQNSTIVSTNTSGIPIKEIAEGRSENFKKHFLGTHFFNPPRYLKLLELIPTENTSADVLKRVAQFGRIHLGKGIVVADDVPYFIGNRIGVYGQLQAIRYFTEDDYSIEEVDELTGPLTGRPKSATFRTADLVGLDVLREVASNLHQKTEHDESRDAFKTPDLINQLVENGKLGAKSGAGFYKKEDGVIKSVDPETLEYTEPEESKLNLDSIRSAGGLEARLNALFEQSDRAGRFFRETTLDLLSYSARRLGEITDNPADVDRAIKWGFGWEMGPFEMWDALGFERVKNTMEEEGYELPGWVNELADGSASFYARVEGERNVYIPGTSSFAVDAPPVDEIDLDTLKPKHERWSNEHAALLDLGEDVMLFEFRSKANSLGQGVMQALSESIQKVEEDPDVRGLVIGNQGKNFSVGANLGEVAQAVQEGKFMELERFLKAFQDTIQQVHYATKPVVVAGHQRVLGGGCEMLMASRHPVASAETYAGLVELGVGLIPAGTGSMRLAKQADERVNSDFPSQLQPVLRSYFEQVAKAEVAESAIQAQQMGYLAENAQIVMHEDRVLHVAKEEVLRLSNQGYRPPAKSTGVNVLGEPTRAVFKVALQQFRNGNYISDYDQHLGEKLAYVMTGGDLSGPDTVTEEYLLELEREVFLELLGEQKTQDRIEHMLKKGKPLRN